MQEYHRDRIIIPPSKQDLYLAGNSRALTLKAADYTITSKAVKGATVTQIENQIEEFSNIIPHTSFVFIIDPICSITQKSTQRAKPVIIFQQKDPSKLLNKLSEIKSKFNNLKIIFPKLQSVNLKRYNHHISQRKFNDYQMQTHLDNYIDEVNIKGIKRINFPLPTPKWPGYVART